MNNTFDKTLIAFAIILASLALAVTAYQYGYQPPVKLSGSSGESSNVFFKTATSSLYSFGNTSTQLFGTSTSRSWGVISNSSPFSIFCNENGNNAANNQGILIAASSTLTIGGSNTFMGAMHCISPSGTANVWIELVQ